MTDWNKLERSTEPLTSKVEMDELTAELIKEAGAETEIIEMPGKNKLERMSLISTPIMLFQRGTDIF
jgi:hypothetical protein